MLSRVASNPAIPAQVLRDTERNGYPVYTGVNDDGVRVWFSAGWVTSQRTHSYSGSAIAVTRETVNRILAAGIRRVTWTLVGVYPVPKELRVDGLANVTRAAVFERDTAGCKVSALLPVPRWQLIGRPDTVQARVPYRRGDGQLSNGRGKRSRLPQFAHAMSPGSDLLQAVPVVLGHEDCQSIVDRSRPRAKPRPAPEA